jgi:hypothetical protein
MKIFISFLLSLFIGNIFAQTIEDITEQANALYTNGKYQEAISLFENNKALFVKSGKTKQKAFKIAQKEIRAKYEKPYYWADFVLMD